MAGMPNSISDMTSDSFNDNPDSDLKIWSCISCRRRKVRCSRRHPCEQCSKVNAECVFPISGRLPKRSRVPNAFNVRAQKQAELVGRLRRLEAMIGSLSSQVEQEVETQQTQHDFDISDKNGQKIKEDSILSSEPASETLLRYEGPDSTTSTSPKITGASSDMEMSESPENDDIGLGLSIADGKDSFAPGGFWNVFCKEVENIFTAIHGPNTPHFPDENAESQPMNTTGGHKYNSYYDFLTRNSHKTAPRQDLYPLPSQMLFLWQIYHENVDPFIKILHVPTVTNVIHGLRDGYQSLTPNWCLLINAIAFAAVMSLGEDDKTRRNFNSEKNALMARYREGTEQAVREADLLSRPDLISLQAFTIYVNVLHYTEVGTAVYIMSGIMTRLAVCLNLHREDADHEGTINLERELRRRLWWQICLTDSRCQHRAAQGANLLEKGFSTRLPAHVNDDDLSTTDVSIPMTGTGWVDTTICLLHCELWKLSQHLQSLAAIGDRKHKLDIFRKAQRQVEEKFFPLAEHQTQLHQFVLAATRLFFAKVHLVLHAQSHVSQNRGSQLFEDGEVEEVANSAMTILDYYSKFQQSNDWKKWVWQTRKQQPPWYALRVLLQQLHRPSEGLAPMQVKQALHAAEKLFACLVNENRVGRQYEQALALFNSVKLAGDDADIAGKNTSFPVEDSVSAHEDIANSVGGNDTGLEMDWSEFDDFAMDSHLFLDCSAWEF